MSTLSPTAQPARLDAVGGIQLVGFIVACVCSIAQVLATRLGYRFPSDLKAARTLLRQATHVTLTLVSLLWTTSFVLFTINPSGLIVVVCSWIGDTVITIMLLLIDVICISTHALLSGDKKTRWFACMMLSSTLVLALSFVASAVAGTITNTTRYSIDRPLCVLVHTFAASVSTVLGVLLKRRLQAQDQAHEHINMTKFVKRHLRFCAVMFGYCFLIVCYVVPSWRFELANPDSVYISEIEGGAVIFFTIFNFVVIVLMLLAIYFSWIPIRFKAESPKLNKTASLPSARTTSLRLGNVGNASSEWVIARYEGTKTEV